MIKQRKVIAQISEYDRKPRFHTTKGCYIHRVSETRIFDSYEDFKEYREKLKDENRGNTDSFISVDWWWWYDQT